MPGRGGRIAELVAGTLNERSRTIELDVEGSASAMR
jgi:hypothetical protein